MKKIFVLLLTLAMVLSLAACGGSGSDSDSGSGSGGGSAGSVYYLNFKPEADEAWKALAAAYTAETGVEVKIQTAASGQYETTLMSEMGKTDAPTLFQVNGPVGLANWVDYCYDMSGSDFYNELTSDDFALKDDSGAVVGIAYVYEGYGIIVNTALLAEAGYSMDDISSFADLKKVAEDITARQSELGFSAFTSAGMDGSSNWRFHTHLADLPLYYEYEDEGYEGTVPAIKGTYLDNFRQVWDLYVNNGTCAPTLLSAKTGDDAVAEFVTEQAVFYQNGTWAYGDIADIGDENLGLLPIYIGVDGESNQGVCAGTENYWCVNSKADPADIQATLDFMYWCVTSETGTAAMADDMGFVCPFKSAKPTENQLNNLMNEMVASGKYSVAWTFGYIPSEEWKSVLGSAMTAYAADQTDANWATVASAFVDGWASEAAK